MLDTCICNAGAPGIAGVSNFEATVLAMCQVKFYIIAWFPLIEQTKKVHANKNLSSVANLHLFPASGISTFLFPPHYFIAVILYERKFSNGPTQAIIFDEVKINADSKNNHIRILTVADNTTL